MQPNDLPISSAASTQSSSGAASAVVLGGGLAGIAAATRLAELGVAVTLVEAAERLGGRARSVLDPVTGEAIDNCHHILLGCCTNLVDLYRRLGVLDRIAWHRTLCFADRLGRIDSLEADDLPAPLHLIRGVAAMTTLTAREKFAIARGVLAILQIGDRGRRYLRDISFAQWLAEQNQPPGAVRKFWSPVIINACNDRPQQVAARYAVQVFQEGLLSHERAYELGLPRVPLAELYDAAEAGLIRAGTGLRKATAVVGFDFDGHRIAAVRLAEGEKLRAGAYICAVPFDRLAGLCSELMVVSDPRLAAVNELQVSPIVGIHLYLRPAAAQPSRCPAPQYLALLDSPLQWVFNRGRVQTGPHRGAVYIHAVAGAAHDLVDLPACDVAALALAQVRRVLPDLAQAELVDQRVIAERQATLSARPGVDHFRPGATGAIDNLLLAGDWVDTGWPASLEGAVRSGYRAAAAAMRLQGHAVADADLLAPSLPPGPLYRFMSG